MLQKCQECGKEYSSLAKSCPNCACPNLHHLEIESAYRGKKEKKNAAAAEISESLFQMRLSLTLLIVTIALTVLMMQVGIAPANVESQSFIEFMSNPQDWISFYTSFFIVFLSGLLHSFLRQTDRRNLRFHPADDLCFMAGVNASAVSPGSYNDWIYPVPALSDVCSSADHADPGRLFQIKSHVP